MMLILDITNPDLPVLIDEFVSPISVLCTGSVMRLVLSGLNRQRSILPVLGSSYAGLLLLIAGTDHTT